MVTSCLIPPGASVRRAQSGFSYLWLLLLVGLMGLGLSGASDIYSTVAKREREKELMAIGRQFQEAIRRYREFRPAGARREYPASLEDLLLDPRSPGKLRHLRKVFVDPMTRKAEWGLVLVEGRVVGVHSLSTEAVLKKEGFDPDLVALAGKSNYAEWLFIDPSVQAVAPPEVQRSGENPDPANPSAGSN